jgi:hypothetical protein
MGVSGQRHAPAALYPPGKEPPVPIVQEAGWAPEPVWIQRLEEKFFALYRGWNPDRPVVQPVVRHYTAWATPAPRKIIYKIKIQHLKKYNFFENQNSTVRLPVKQEVCELRTCFSFCICLKERTVYKIQSSTFIHISQLSVHPLPIH